MRGLEVTLTIFVLVYSKCYYLCHAEHNKERIRLNETERRIVFPLIQPAPGLEGPNPCNRKLPEKPNFIVPGQRISVAKCNEFQWILKRRLEKFRQDFECDKYRKANNLEELLVPEVIGGRISEPGEFPHMGALGWRAVVGGWKFQCGCALISTKFLLTAAHCSSASPRDTTIADVKPEIVRLGVIDINGWADDVNLYDAEILQVIVHPQYASPKKYNDIALVELKRALIFINSYIEPACLWSHTNTTALGNRAFVTGWGYIDADGQKKAEKLQAAEVNIIDSTQCDALLKLAWNRHFKGLQSHQMCAGVLDGGIDTCQGDSGGPLQVKIPSTDITLNNRSYIIGVTSFGHGCARARSPGIYTRVSSFIDWIESIVWHE